jgi:hypothetical protein
LRPQSKLQKAYRKKAYKPLDFRVKKTHAIRIALTEHQKGLKTLKATKKVNFPLPSVVLCKIVECESYVP